MGKSEEVTTKMLLQHRDVGSGKREKRAMKHKA